MTPVLPAKSQNQRTRVLQAATSLGLIGSATSAVARLLALLCNPEVSSDEIAALIETHPVLCARVLRVANSAYYGRHRAVATVKQAVLLMGLDAVRGVAAAACIDRATPRQTQTALLNIPALMSHSLATAVAAQSLGRMKCEPLAAEAFIAGVLHNLGVAAQACIDPSGIGAMIDARRAGSEHGIRALEVEHSVVGHEECIAVVLDAWQLPESLVAATSHHHAPGEAPPPHSKLAALVNLGATLAHSAGYAAPLEPILVERDAQAMSHLDLTAADLDRVAVELPEQARDMQRALLGA
jgi:HD-like signal output (HDOD) protein